MSIFYKKAGTSGLYWWFVFLPIHQETWCAGIIREYRNILLVNGTLEKKNWGSLVPHSLCLRDWAKSLGTLTDILGGRRVISIGILITAIMFSLFAFAGGYHAAIIIRVLMGFVGAATFVPCMAVLSRWFSKKERGMVLNIFWHRWWVR